MNTHSIDPRDLLRVVPDFPKAGIQFLDISPILHSPTAFRQLLKQLQEKVNWQNIDVIIGIESRGFILGAALASLQGVGFVPCRKAGKLPPPVIGASYQLEYGRATIEMHMGKGRALIVDDVLATGGTLSAAAEVAQKCGYEVVDALVLINISALNSWTLKNRPALALWTL